MSSTSTPPPQGYVLDSSYPDTFFQELSPAWLSYVSAVSGARAKPLDSAFTYLELGAGLAHSTVVNAGAFPRGEFHACDFNPEHVEGGRRYASALDVRNIEIHEASFERLLEKKLPPFDFIVLHGVYSWVGAESRAAIRRIINEKLASGGLVYVSYNCMPGWASELPVRRLLVELASAARGDSSEKMRRAVELLAQMRGLRYFEANPEAARAIESYARVPPNYLAHEFFNETWQPFYSADVIDELAQAGASYLGSATLTDNHPTLLVEESATDSLKNLTSPRQQHLALDFATNRRFRRDVFIRSDTARSPEEAARAINDAVIGSVSDPRQLPTRIKVPRGHISFQPDFIESLKGLLRHGSVTFADAVATLSGKSRNTAEIARNLAFLVAGGALMPFARVYRYDQPSEVRKPANALVERSLRCIIEQRAARAIPSELLGNGILVKPSEALAIIELLSGSRPGPSPVEQHVATTLLPNLARLKLVD
ncbi:MAG: class I SAM-dependent methyltransferase [Gammaproteobacteria bacterium]